MEEDFRAACSLGRHPGGAASCMYGSHNGLQVSNRTEDKDSKMPAGTSRQKLKREAVALPQKGSDLALLAMVEPSHSDVTQYSRLMSGLGNADGCPHGGIQPTPSDMFGSFSQY